jgi:DNA polymerase III subunit epsilon
MSVFAAIDFETANRYPNSACALGIVRVENNHVTHKEYYLIRPPINYFEFTYIHGLEWSDVKNQPTYQQLWPAIDALICDVDFIAAHNARFDQRVMYACCDRYRLPRPRHSFLCTVQLARKVWNVFPTKLPNVCEFLNISLEHHHALSDAEACAGIVIAANKFRT